MINSVEELQNMSLRQMAQSILSYDSIKEIVKDLIRIGLRDSDIHIVYKSQSTDIRTYKYLGIYQLTSGIDNALLYIIPQINVTETAIGEYVEIWFLDNMFNTNVWSLTAHRQNYCHTKFFIENLLVDIYDEISEEEKCWMLLQGIYNNENE